MKSYMIQISILLMKIIVITFSKDLKYEHYYDVSNCFDYTNSISVSRSIAADKIFDILSYTLILRI